jgi:tetratricopeptide (TPR) repeat protein
MYRYLLVFTDDDRAKLQDRYHGLMQMFEAGASIGKSSMDELKEIMRVMLEGQKGLQSFWQEVQKQPDRSYHLHLMYNEKELLNLPWHMAVNPNVHISKGPLANTALPAYKPQPGPLRILVMISSPDDLQYDKRLSYEEEEEIILKALSPLLVAGLVQVYFTEDGSLENLREKLKLQHYHILYFGGHGIYKNDAGYLQLEDAITLKSKEIKAEQFARALKEDDLHAPPLVVLSSCQTAQGSMEDGFRGVADELIHEGVPAVIAMAFSIKDQFNILFAGHLYEHLANKCSLAEGYSKALRDLRRREQQELERLNQQHNRPSQWLIPQLYLSQRVDDIVDWQADSMDGPPVERGSLRHVSEHRFIGRRRECALLLNELIYDKPVLITGQGGIGKTALAGYLVKRLVVRDAAYYCFAFDESSFGIGPMVSQLLQYLRTADPQYNDAYEAEHIDFLVNRVTKLCKPVWVFDNLESCQPNSDWMKYAQGRLFLKFPVILLSRYEVPELERVFNLRLNQAPFVDFYRKYMELDLAGLHTEINVPERVDVADLLYRMFGGHYRTLESLNEVYVNNPVKTQALLRQIATRKDAATPAKALMQDVRENIESSGKPMNVAELLTLPTIEELKTLHLLFRFDRPVATLALEMQQAGRNFDADLQRLRNFTLIEEEIHKETGRKLYYVAPLVKNAVEGIELPQVYFYPEYAGDYCYLAYSKISFSYGDLEAALHYFKMSRSVTKLNEAGTILVNHYYHIGLFNETLYYGEMVEEMAGDGTAGEILKSLGLVHLKYGNSKQALIYFTRFSIVCRKAGEDKKLAYVFNAIGRTYDQMNDPDTALEWLDKSIRLSKTIQDKSQEAIALSNMGQVYCDVGEEEKAMNVFQQCFQIRKETGDLRGQVGVLNNICRIYSGRGEYRKVIEKLQEALVIAVEIGDNRMQALVLNNIGYALMSEGDLNSALICFQKNLAVSESFEDEEEKGKALVGMGTAYRNLGNHDEAIERLTEGASILQKFDYPHIQHDTAMDLGDIYLQRGDAALALVYLDKALAGFRKGNRAKEAAQALRYMGDAYLRLNDIDKSIQHLEACLMVLEEVDDKEIESMALTSLAQAHAVKDDPDKVLDLAEKKLEIARTGGDRVGEADALFNMALVYLEKRLPELYLHYCLESYTIQSETNNLGGLYFMSSVLGAFLCNNCPEKYLNEGLWFLEQAYEIGIQSSEFPGVEHLGSMIDEMRRSS